MQLADNAVGSKARKRSSKTLVGATALQVFCRMYFWWSHPLEASDGMESQQETLKKDHVTIRVLKDGSVSPRKAR
jgi:hypothetical protein